MKRVFFFGVIIYSVLIFLLNDLPTATNLSGVPAVPWMAKCLVDFFFAGSAIFSMFGSQIHWDDDEEGIHAEDVKVNGTWLYGLFGLNLLANFGWHGYQFAIQTGAYGLYNAMWFFVEAVAMFLTFVFFRHALAIARREQRKAREAAKGNSQSQQDQGRPISGVRSIA